MFKLPTFLAQHSVVALRLASTSTLPKFKVYKPRPEFTPTKHEQLKEKHNTKYAPRSENRPASTRDWKTKSNVSQSRTSPKSTLNTSTNEQIVQAGRQKPGNWFHAREDRMKEMWKSTDVVKEEFKDGRFDVRKERPERDGYTSVGAPKYKYSVQDKTNDSYRNKKTLPENTPTYEEKTRDSDSTADKKYYKYKLGAKKIGSSQRHDTDTRANGFATKKIQEGTGETLDRIHSKQGQDIGQRDGEQGTFRGKYNPGRRERERNLSDQSTDERGTGLDQRKLYPRSFAAKTYPGKNRENLADQGGSSERGGSKPFSGTFAANGYPGKQEGKLAHQGRGPENGRKPYPRSLSGNEVRGSERADTKIQSTFGRKDAGTGLRANKRFTEPRGNAIRGRDRDGGSKVERSFRKDGNARSAKAYPLKTDGDVRAASPFSPAKTDGFSTRDSSLAPSPVVGDEGKWYSDPFLLSKKVERILSRKDGSISSAISLVERHTGAGNEHVYATLIKLLSNRGEHEQVIRICNEQRAKKRTFTSAGYVVFLGSILKDLRATKKRAARQLKFSAAVEVWNEILKSKVNTTKEIEGGTEESGKINDVSLFHCNSMLQICEQCSDIDGSKVLGNKIFKSISKPDQRTFTFMFQFCGSNSMLSEADEIMKSMPADLIDERCIASFLKVHVQCATEKDSESEIVLGLLSKYFGLPKTHSNSIQEIPAPTSETFLGYTNISTATLGIILMIAQRWRYPALGQTWYTICTAQRGVVVDAGITSIYASLLISSKDYEKAFTQTLPLLSSSQKFTHAFKICSSAVNEDPELWTRRCKLMYNESIDSDFDLEVRDLYHILQTLTSSKSWLDCLSIIGAHESVLIDETRRVFEASAAGKAVVSKEKLELRMKSLGLVRLTFRNCESEMGDVGGVLLLRKLEETLQVAKIMGQTNSEIAKDGGLDVGTIRVSKKKLVVEDIKLL